jgi:diguanylate cyclase (GGDEF)-like protein
VVKAMLGPFDLFGRLGGEEFAIMLYDTDREKGNSIAEAIRLAFAQEAVKVGGRPVGGTVSIGMVVNEDGMLDVSTLLAQADEALYMAKERGRDRVEIASLDMILQRARKMMTDRKAAASGQPVTRAPSAA